MIANGARTPAILRVGSAIIKTDKANVVKGHKSSKNARLLVTSSKITPWENSSHGP
jgi:hypothetical protein